MQLANKILRIQAIQISLVIFITAAIHVIIILNTNLGSNLTPVSVEGGGVNGLFIIMLIIEVIICLLVIIWLNYRNNKRFIAPISKVVDNLQRSEFITIGKHNGMNEVAIIQRSLDTLHSQLNFYVHSQKKNQENQQKIEKEIEIAKKLQRNILPKNNKDVDLIPNIDVFASSESAYDLGGDLYDYFMLDDKNLLFVVADITGKGIPASLFMIFTHTLLRSIAAPNLEVSEIANKLNDKLIEENISDLFVTMFLGIIDTNSGIINYCNAAHNQPILIKNEGSFIELTNVHGIPLGIYPDRNYKSSKIELEKNDQLFIYTDGIVDSKDENEMNFSVDVLKFNLVGSWFKSPKENVEKIVNDITSFRGTKNPVDDTTMMVVKFTPGI